MITMGFDLGSAAIKAVMAEEGQAVWCGTLPATAHYVHSCELLFRKGLGERGVAEEDLAGIAATGYGKGLFSRADKVVNEISANALGAFSLSDGQLRSIINIGGQDVKIIKLWPDGSVADFRMNDKCAAGTGRFFEMAERILDAPLADFGSMDRESTSPAEIGSTCAVFAETELISLMARGVDRNDIVAGLNRAIAARISSLAENMDLADGICLDGGPALNSGLHRAMGEEMGREVQVLEQPQFTVALGAALAIARERGR